MKRGILYDYLQYLTRWDKSVSMMFLVKSFNVIYNSDPKSLESNIISEYEEILRTIGNSDDRPMSLVAFCREYNLKEILK
jgi:hypothetical protein